MLPNTGESCPEAQSMGVNALVLSGSDDIGATPLRDASEIVLLRWTASRDLPVLGVCRGLQMLQHYFGGGLDRLDPERHVRARHPLGWMDRKKEMERREINSYHQLGLLPDTLVPELETLALCPEDGSVKVLRARHLPWLGIIWHPEREAVPHPEDLKLFRRHSVLRRAPEVAPAAA